VIYHSHKKTKCQKHILHKLRTPAHMMDVAWWRNRRVLTGDCLRTGKPSRWN